MSREGKHPKRILFIGEAVTLAHVARPHVLANELCEESFEVTLACDPRFSHLFADAKYSHLPIESVPTQQFLDKLASGSPVYSTADLDDYVQADLKLLEQFRPDVVIGDFRLSLSLSARLAKIPYYAIMNAYWTPDADLRCPAPDLPMMRWVGDRAGQLLFDLVKPIGFAMHARPMNRLRKRYGFASLGPDVRRVYTDADQLLFADPPELSPIPKPPENAHFLGPVQWSPHIPFPPWWGELDPGLPVIYVTMGSSGAIEILPEIMAALADGPWIVVASTAGRGETARIPKNTFVADYLPGDDVSKRASLVICNGGSPATYQAISAECHIVAIPSNLDQCLNSEMLRRQGLAEVIRTGGVKTLLRETVLRKLDEAKPPRRFEKSPRGLSRMLDLN